MSLHGKCHMPWEDLDGITHLCGQDQDHEHWHLCPCGEVLHRGNTTLTAEQRQHRSVDCPICLARAGRPCIHRREQGTDLTMPGVHGERQALAKRRRQRS